ncbi:MAG TPA: DUF4038 domain-containing protein [Kofleriaceae bacterium]|nr:DUF4038 domain-containing protein [Kofleriaceae bacterium]
MAALAAACGPRTAPVPECGGPARTAALAFPLRRAGACLVDASGAPVWLNGEAAWSLIVQLDDAELDRYLADRRARGFNALVVNLIEHKFADHAPRDRAGDPPFTVPGDFATPDEAYFAHVDRVLARTAAAGMAVLLAPAYLGYEGGDEGWYAEVRRNGPDKLRGYGRYLGARYRTAPNLVWLEGGDAPPMDAGDEIEALVAGIREADPVHLHAAHSTRYHSALDDYDRPWLDLNTTYSDCEGHGRQLLRDAHRVRGIPTLFIEGTYEGEKASLGCTISQAYRTLLSGAAGHVFGNKPIWEFGAGWPDALDSPGSRAMQHLAALLAAHDLRGLTPDFPGAPAGDGLAAARARSGTTLVLVDAGPRPLQLPAAAIARRAAWFDPATGATRDAGVFAAGAPLAVTAPAGGPWLLIAEEAAIPGSAPAARSGSGPRSGDTAP